jgi:hypothetical protein
MDRRAHRGEGGRAGIGPGKTGNAVAGGDQLPNDGGADEAGGASDEYTHKQSPGIGRGLVERTICARIIRVK